MPGPQKTHHHITREPTTLSHCLTQHFRLDPSRSAELIELGSIYVNRRRMETDCTLKKGAHIEAHLQPVRFPTEGIVWSERIVFDRPDYLIVNKPSGIPVHATNDNLRDNLLYQLREATGHALYVTQRIDTPTSGLVVLAKHPDFQKLFNRYLASRQVTKIYRALVVKEVPCGKMIHYMEPSETTPRKVDKKEHEGWLTCELEVLSSNRILISPLPSPFTELRISLLTGRTHQIRAQLADLGFPIVGDKLYRSTVRYSRLKLGSGIALFSESIEFPKIGGGCERFRLDPPWKFTSVPYKSDEHHRGHPDCLKIH